MIPGGNALELRVSTANATQLEESLERLPGVSKVEQVTKQPDDGPDIVTYRVYSENAASLVGAAAQAVLTSGGEVRDLHLKQASLEEVFIYLTGRHLR
jgi:hypothetical protein